MGVDVDRRIPLTAMQDDRSRMDALITLHRDLPRQGPGDDQFTLNLLERLPPLPARPRIADLGCGSGAGAVLLARHYRSAVRAVDASAVFIEELRVNAMRAGVDQLVEPICADMGALDWPRGSIDLLWSEGAAYNLGFEQALRRWRPLLAATGVAVISELSWFETDVPAEARAFWQAGYPGMATEVQNLACATNAGFRAAFTARLPVEAWWRNYYDPLRERIRQLDSTVVAGQVIRETEQEIALFEKYSDYYGYTFYVLLIAD